MNITIPDLALVMLVGASGSGKSTFARTHFKPTEVISSDACRAMVCDDENSLEATKDAFEVLHFITAKRLAGRRLTVIDATNVQPEARRTLIALAREYHCMAVAIVFDLSERICQERNVLRTDRTIPPHAIRNQVRQLRRSLKDLKREGVRHLTVFRSPDEIDQITITREPLWTDKRSELGPFDIIGDVHGCCDELETLLEQLGYEAAHQPADDATRRYTRLYQHPEGRRAIFVGDIVDRGPRILDSYELVRNMVEAGTALAVPGNHDIKLVKKLGGANVQVRHGLEQTIAELEGIPEEMRDDYNKAMHDFFDRMVSHFLLDNGRLAVAHAGVKEEMQGRASNQVRSFALFGETTGETDEFGLPVRYNWAAEYRGAARVVYGHTPVPRPEWLNRTINVDTGCVFGGSLTALRYPEMELVSVPAARVYAEPIRPIGGSSNHEQNAQDAQQLHDDLLDISDVLGKRVIHTRLDTPVTIREENGRAALEVMSRFAVDPKWLIYLPPTMSPSATSNRDDLLEHPEQAFEYYREQGITQVICEEKHMGSRATVVLCKDAETARQRFGVTSGERGTCYTRTGRPFFSDQTTTNALLDRVHNALERSGLWEELNTSWIALDCELMPWSAKALELLRGQYAAVGAAATAGLAGAITTLEQAERNGVEVGELVTRFRQRAAMTGSYIDAYRRYCWPVNSIDDLKLAPFHILATEGTTHVGKDHRWHMETIARFAQDSPSLLATPFRLVDVTDAESVNNAILWWEQLTARGGEGMVVKPLDFIADGPKGIVQPAVKCRGREYLRIIYGPEYSAPDQIAQLRGRGLGLKRSLALREFTLGVEALERFVEHAPLRHVHECVFGVLALESEPVDPRL